MNRATILHVDLDAFFAAVEQRDRPELRGRPVVVSVGGRNDRGVVSAASYEARTYGIHSAMPLRTAARLCENAVFVPVDGRKYGAVSKQVMEILRRYTPAVEQISIDEAFLDVAGSEALLGTPVEMARSIRQTVQGELQLTVSVGVAATKLVAKVASDLEKPDGLVVVVPGTEADFATSPRSSFAFSRTSASGRPMINFRFHLSSSSTRTSKSISLSGLQETCPKQGMRRADNGL